MRNGIRSVALRQERIAQLQMRRIEVRAQLQRAPERRDRRFVIVHLRVNFAEIEKTLGEIGTRLGGLAKFADGFFESSLLVRLHTCLHMLRDFRRNILQGQRQKQDRECHGRSGSRTSRNCLTGTSFSS